MNISIIGSGNVATRFAMEFFAKGHQIIEIWSRMPEHADVLAAKVNARVLSSLYLIERTVDLLVISVSDDAISMIAEELPTLKGLVVHTAGSVDVDVLEKFPHRGVFYPLQTLSKGRNIPFHEIPLCIEAFNSKDAEILHQLGTELGAPVYSINSKQRRYCHLSAVFASNFVNHMLSVSDEILAQHQIPQNLLYPLIDETIRKARSISPREAQTGPARRNDINTMNRHLELLTSLKLQNLYRFVSESIQEYNSDNIR